MTNPLTLLRCTALVGALALTATACGSSGGATADRATGSDGPKTVTVNKPFSDDGGSGTVVAVARRVPVPTAVVKKHQVLADDEVVAVEVRVVASDKAGAEVPGPDSMYLTGTPVGAMGVNPTLDDVLTASHLTPFAVPERGKTATGWVAFTPQSGLKHLVFQYRQFTGGTRKNIDIPLPD